MDVRIQKPLKLVALLTSIVAIALITAPFSQAAPNPPSGLTALSLDGNVQLSWQAASGATGYKVYRGTSAGAINQLVGSPSQATFTDSAAANGSSYYYAVTATTAVAESPPSNAAGAAPQARSCSSGNAIVVENCFPGSTAWKLTAAGTAYSGSIEGFATQTSINAGQSVDLKVNTGPNNANAPYHLEVYRMGWYGGKHARLIETVPGLRGVAQPSCQDPGDNTGLLDCSNWQTTTTLTTTTSWPSGVYWIRLSKDDNNTENAILLTIRNDGGTAPILYQVPVATYQAYNNYGGKSLYDFNSNGYTTIAGTTRAVAVSYDRPFAQTYTQDPNWFAYQDVANVGFLEHQGYDINYVTSVDVHANGSQLTSHKAFVSPTHDEYWSAEMRQAVTAARDAGTNLLWLGSNQVYWKIRFAASPFSSVANRVEISYKSTQSGPADPVSPTGTWRDPAGANAPENALAGQMYIGDNDQQGFPMVISAAQGQTRFWRHTELAALAPGTSLTLGQKLVGWEWNATVNNGQQPAGVQLFTASPVTGELVQHNGRDYLANQSATANGTFYRAASGAWVVSTGTNNWTRGLDLDGNGAGEPNVDIQQATVNMLADMGAQPTTLMSGLVVDPAGGPSLTATSPADASTGFPIASPVTATFDRSLDPATVTTQNFTLTPQGGSPLAASVSYDDSTHKATLTPTSALTPQTNYTAKLVGGSGGIASWGGALASTTTFGFKTGAGTPPQVSSTSPANNASGVSLGATVSVTFNRAMDATTLTSQSFTLSSSSGGVAGSVSYNSANNTATFTPNAALAPTTQYTATVTTAAKASDGTALAQAYSFSFTTATALTVTSTTPAANATGISPGAIVRAVFSRAVDPTTLTAQTFTLSDGQGSPVTGQIGYDPNTRSASLVPGAALALNTTYRATVTTGVKGADGSPLLANVSWQFATAASQPVAPTVTAVSPPSGATSVSLDSTVTATFDRALDGSTVTGQSFLLTDSKGTAVAGTVSYSSSNTTATFAPTANLAPAQTYTAQLTTQIRGSDGTPLASSVSWSFTAADCPCSLMSSLSPAVTNLPVQDGRGGSGPFSYEMGTKISVSQPMQIVAIRFYKDANETGTHIGTLWSSTGTALAAATFQNETASGWQRQALAGPVALQANTTYVVSVGLNSRFVMTSGGLAAALTSGPLQSVADGKNGVFGNSAGTFPTQSWANSNYFVDATVTTQGSANIPQVTARSPVAGATNVPQNTTVTATFSTALDATTVNGSSFQLLDGSNSVVPATVTYNAGTKTATLTPSSGLATGASYTAKLTTAIRADDETPMPANVTWQFATASSTAPAVASTSPASASTQVSTLAAVQATFNTALDATTVNGQTFTLSDPGGTKVSASVSYNATTSTATLTPSSALTASTTYTALLTTGVKNSAGTAMAASYTWQFTTSACPCSLFGNSGTPQWTGLTTQDGRSGPGPWSYELGAKIQVTQPAGLTAIRFYKDAKETGAHTGTLWSASGTKIASVNFANETPSGWQEQVLPTPVSLTPGVTYVVSVGFNAMFVDTPRGLATQITNGPLQSGDPSANGVYGLSAGVFPNSSYQSSNYWVDAVVR